MSWGIQNHHVWPLDDLKDHELEKDCWCKPLLDGNIIVHNSMDGREDYENNIRQKS